MPLRLPARPLTRAELENRLLQGDRRQGYVLYRTACPDCRECIPLRLVTSRVSISRSQRRVLRRTSLECKVELGRPGIDGERVRLYNLHKTSRNLADGQRPIDANGYREFLLHSCCETFEMRYIVAGKVVGVALVDRALRSLSSVYCYYDPQYSHLSLGTFSILKQLELCSQWGLDYLYLGLYIEGSAPMRYKARIAAHERLIGNQWLPFMRDQTRPAKEVGER